MKKYVVNLDGVEAEYIPFESTECPSDQDLYCTWEEMRVDRHDWTCMRGVSWATNRKDKCTMCNYSREIIFDNKQKHIDSGYAVRTVAKNGEELVIQK